MYQVGDYVIYKHDVCKIKEIMKNHFRNQDYYSLVPMDDESLTIEVPVLNPIGNIRSVIDRDEVERIIQTIPNIPIIESNDRMLENEYRKLINSNKHEDLIKIIKTTYLRNQKRVEENKKIGDKDNFYFEKAEKFLYNEFSIVLNMSYDDTKKYVLDAVLKLEKNEN